MTDYTQVIRKYQSDKALAQKNLRYWQLISLGLLVITGYSVYHLATQREGIEIKPYLVQVDNIGTAVASGLLEDSQFDVEHNEKIIRALLFRYIQQAKGISSDATVMQSNLKDVHRMTIPSLYTHYLMPFYEKDDPFISASTFTRTVRPINFLRQSPKTFIVEWEEDDRDNSKQLIKTTRWKAYIGIKTEQKTTKSQIEEDIFNPLGIYVTNLEWSPNL